MQAIPFIWMAGRSEKDAGLAIGAASFGQLKNLARLIDDEQNVQSNTRNWTQDCIHI